MIIVRLKGGLGNQLFQYAMGRMLALHHQTSLILDTAEFARDPLRNYRLDSFQIDAKPSNQFWFFPENRIGRRFNPLLQAFRKVTSHPIALIREARFSFEPQALLTPNYSYLDGYWQSEKYFTSIEDQLRNDLCLSIRLNTAQAVLAGQINQDPFAVALHVRRGDYVADPATTAFHGLCSIEWYQQAADLILKQVPSAHFYIFSDDYEWVKNNLKLPVLMRFIEPSPDGQEAIDLHLMSLCQHNIIANSSFSWWGAWLNANPNKIVIAPQRWFAAGHQDTSDLIPEKWIRL
jgi:hypothetical protein